MYIRACSISCTSTLSEFSKEEKKIEEHYRMPRPVRRKLFPTRYIEVVNAVTYSSKYRGSTHCFPHDGSLASTFQVPCQGFLAGSAHHVIVQPLHDHN